MVAANKDTGEIKWEAETNNQFIYIATKGDGVTEYVDLKPQNPNEINWLEDNHYLYYFNKDQAQEVIIPLDTEKRTQQRINSFYNDSDTKVVLRKEEYYFNHDTGTPCAKSPSAFKIEIFDYYVHRASPSWSIRFSHFEAWFPSPTGIEKDRCPCVVFHSRNSLKFFQACKLWNLLPDAGRDPINEFIVNNVLYTTNKKIECPPGGDVRVGKHNVSIIEGYYDKIEAVVKKVKIKDDDKGTELKEKLRKIGYHENVVAFLDWERDAEYNYYAYEHGGVTLANHLRNHPYVEMEESSMKIINGLVHGVKHLHDQGLAHMNLNPLNILVKNSTTVKICGMSNCEHLTPDGLSQDLHDLVHVILYIISNGQHVLPDEEKAPATLIRRFVTSADLDRMNLTGANAVGTNCEAIDLLEKTGIIQATIPSITTLEELMRLLFFWDAPRRMAFFTDLSNHLNEGNPDPALKAAIENLGVDVVNTHILTAAGRPSWYAIFPNLIPCLWRLHQKRYKNAKRVPRFPYQDGEVSKLIKLPRNTRSHFQETRRHVADPNSDSHTDSVLKAQEIGGNDKELEEKLRVKVPKLLTKTHAVVRVYQANIDILKQYYR